MRTILLSFFLFLLPSALYCQNMMPANDSLFREILILKQKIDLATRSKDSLERELLFYKVKEDTYSDLFGALSSHFEGTVAWIVGIFGAIAGLVSFGFYKRVLQNVARQLSKYKSEFDSANKMQSDAIRNYSERNYRQFSWFWNTNATLPFIVEYKRIWLIGSAVEQYIMAVEINKNKEDDEIFEILLNTFYIAVKNLNPATIPPSDIDGIKKVLVIFQEHTYGQIVKLFSETNREKAADIVAEIQSKKSVWPNQQQN